VRIGRASTEGMLAPSAGTLLGIYSGSRPAIVSTELKYRSVEATLRGALDVRTQAYDDAPAFLLKIALDFDIWKVEQVQ
jgi:hypothetical protein